jgi:hypothetical protein
MITPEIKVLPPIERDEIGRIPEMCIVIYFVVIEVSQCPTINLGN